MKIIFSSILFTFIIFIVSCNKETVDDNLWSESQNLYTQKDYNNCVVKLTKIINNNNSAYAPKALFLISEIYLNEYEEYDISISYLDRIINQYPDIELAKRSLFTKAYIKANYIESYTEAIDLYNDFINKYPQDDLISSIKYELNELKKYETKINQMINR